MYMFIKHGIIGKMCNSFLLKDDKGILGIQAVGKVRQLFKSARTLYVQMYAYVCVCVAVCIYV
jgi:hypothetical protein